MPYSIRKPSPDQIQKVRSTMPIKGVNELMLPTFLKPTQATKIINYFIRLETELYERGGIKQLQRVATVASPKLFIPWTDTLFILGYGTTLAVFNLNDDTINTIKSDFTHNLTGATRYGLDVYTCNSKYGQLIFKTTLPTLAYDAQSANFAIWLTLTGATSGATATIIADTDWGATGTLKLDNINGVFQTDEIITDSATGSATANGVVTYTNTATITATAGTVPKCEDLSVFDKSLVAIGTNNDDSEVLLSKVNVFTDWDTTATDMGDAYQILYKFAGEAVTSANLQSSSTGSDSYGNVLVAGFKDGYAGFVRSAKQTTDGTTVQIFDTVFEKLNDGMEQNALSTPLGIFFTNENGIFLLYPDGNRVELTRNIERSRKSKFDFGDCDIAWSSFDNRLYVTLKENSDYNNLILWFDTRSLKEILWGEIPYYVARFFTKGNKVYGIASITPRVLEMFSEEQFDDEGAEIYCEYKQPMNIGNLETVKDFVQLDLGGDITPTAPLTVQVLGVNESGGEEVQTDIEYTWSATGGLSTESEFATAELGKDGFVATPESLMPIWTPSTWYKKAYGFNSYTLKFFSSDKFPSIIRYATASIIEQRNQRANILT